MNPYLETLYSKTYSITGVKRRDRFLVEPDPEKVLGIFLGFLFFYNQESDNLLELFMPQGKGWIAEMAMAAAYRLTEPEDFSKFSELPFELAQHEIWEVSISSVWQVPSPLNVVRLTGDNLRKLISEAEAYLRNQ
jgi:hypothetical protein